MKELTYPPRTELARLPTPLVHLPRTSKFLGVEFYIKRDDTTGVELSGNKIRKLEFLLADALAQGADTIITCGGEQSNHCRATALAAARLGLSSVLLLRTEDPGRPPRTAGNILLDRLAGAEIVWISREDYGRRHELMAGQAERLRQAGQVPYIIPEGGSNAVGAWGYLRAAEELSRDLAALPPKPTSIIYATGSGGTGAGLVLGAKYFGFAERDIRVTGVCVCDDREYFLTTIGKICADFEQRFGLGITVGPEDIEILASYVGEGYGKTQPEELRVLRDLARREGIILDPVYTGKAYYGILSEVGYNSECFGERIVFLHTGGIFGLFPKVEEIEPLL